VSVPTPLSQRTDMVVFFNGEFVPADQARVGIMTHALSYGTGCFEGIRGYWNDTSEDVYIFRPREHFARMHNSCRITSICLPHSVDELMEIARELVRRNHLRENCYIRPFAYKSDEIIGVKLHGLQDHFAMYVWVLVRVEAVKTPSPPIAFTSLKSAAQAALVSAGGPAPRNCDELCIRNGLTPPTHGVGSCTVVPFGATGSQWPGALFGTH